MKPAPIASQSGPSLPALGPDRAGWRPVEVLGLLMAATLLAATPLRAQHVTTDGSVGPAVELGGTDIVVGEELGAARGANLLHSFGRFGVPEGGSVTFTATTPGFQNLLARVTGGEPSPIDGVISSPQIPNVFLMNPAGVIFGDGARLDVPGSFHVTTAESLGFEDALRTSYYADPSLDTAGDSILRTAPPEAFDPLRHPTVYRFGDSPAGIVVRSDSLSVPTGETLDLLGGDVIVEGDGSVFGTTSVSAPGGRVRIASLGAAGEVRTAAADPQGGFASAPPQAGGTVRIAGGARIDAGGDTAGGRIFIQGGRIVVRSSEVATGGNGAGDAGRIDVRATGSQGVSIAGRLADDAGESHRAGLFVEAGRRATGTGGEIAVEAPALVLEDGARIRTQSRAEGTDAAPSADIAVEADAIRVDGGARIDASTQADGRGGTIRLTASEILVTGSEAGGGGWRRG